MATFFGPPLIGNDILDVGSRKADLQARRRQGEMGISNEMMLSGHPGQFDVPNVPDVSKKEC
jgi:hypothetical protein